MNRRILGGLAVAAMLAGGFALTTNVASAEQPDTVHHPEDECAGTFFESQGPNSGTSVNVAYTGDMWIKIGNQHVAVPDVTEGDIIGPADVASWPTDNGGNGNFQAVSHVDYCVPTPETPEWTPPIYPPFTPEVCVEYRLEKQTSTWNGKTGTWSAWADWTAPALGWGEFPDLMTGDHDKKPGEDGHRVFAYLPATTVSPNQRAITTEDCTPTKDPKVEYTEWQDATFTCEDDTVEQTRTATTTTYTWNGEGFDESVSSVTETKTRVLTDEETTCPIPDPPTTPTDDVAQLPPPATPAAPVVVAANSPAQAPTTIAPAVSPAVPAAGLPATGIDGTGITALIALLLTSLGGAALFLSRRRDVTT